LPGPDPGYRVSPPDCRCLLQPVYQFADGSPGQCFQQVLAKEPDFETAKKDIQYNRLFHQYIKARDGEKAEKIMAEHFDTLDEIIKQRQKTLTPRGRKL
jgi:hypothetical protein